jgi:hypothetical protein
VQQKLGEAEKINIEAVREMTNVGERMTRVNSDEGTRGRNKT